MAQSLALALVIAFTIVFCLVDSPAEASASADQIGDHNNTLTAAQTKRLNEFMQCLPVGEAKSIKFAGTKFPRDARPYIELEVNQGFPGEYAKVCVDIKDGTVYRYVDMGDWTKEEDLQEKSIREAISVEQAFAAAVPMLTHFGLPLTFGEYDVSLVNMGPKSGETRLEDALWWVKKDFSHQGVPCRGCDIAIVLSPFSGKLLMLGYDPPIIPQAPVKRITKMEATENARIWLEANKYIGPSNPVVDSGALDEIKYVIALPNDFGIPVHEAEPEEGPVKSFYCWEVPFYYTQDDNTFEARIWVNVETGQVIGGR